MATDRPRVQAYIDPALYEYYEDWKKERGIDKDSPALNQILAEYFGVSSQSPIPNPQSLITTEQIEEMIEEECSSRMQEIKEHIAAKLPTLTELDSKIDGYVQERMTEQSEEWMNQLGERFYGRIYALEQKVRILENAAKPEISHVFSESASELPSELPHESLTQTELAKRLGCHKSLISRHKGDGKFEAWSRGKDPDAIAWCYDRKNQKFIPLAP